MRYISLFSGIEAASVAWRDLPGFEPVAFCEIDKFPSAVLAHRFPDVPNIGDICEVDWKEVIEKYGAVDLIVGGSPCQSFSIAAGANRTSLDGKSNLMWEYVRAVRDVRPQWVIWENVPAVLNTKDDAFGGFLNALYEIRYRDLAWRVFDAQFFGVAQRRRRVFLVGYLADNGNRSAAVLFDSGSVQGAFETNARKRAKLAEGIERNPDATICMVNDTSNASLDYDLCGTLLAGGGSPPMIARVRSQHITEKDCALMTSQAG